MADVFISYSRKDRTSLERLTQILEESGITCWTAPRNLTHAYNYEEQIPNAIAECSLLVFLASKNSVEAKGCQGELEFAYNLKKIILPIYLEQVQMPASQSLYSVGIRPIHLYRDYEKGLDWVKTAVLDYLGRAETKEPSPEIVPGNKNSVAEDAPKVFISHDSDDAYRVGKYVKILEDKGIPCWIAPRDIPYGSNYAREIPVAIESCSCFLVFVSEKSQSSEEIEKEIEIANKFSKKIIPAKLDNCDFSGPYMYHLTNKQWFTAYNASQEDKAKLIRELLPPGGGSGEKTKNEQDHKKQEEHQNASGMKQKIKRIKQWFRGQKAPMRIVLLLLALFFSLLLGYVAHMILLPVLEVIFGELFGIFIFFVLIVWLTGTIISA